MLGRLVEKETCESDIGECHISKDEGIRLIGEEEPGVGSGVGLTKRAGELALVPLGAGTSSPKVL